MMVTMAKSSTATTLVDETTSVDAASSLIHATNGPSNMSPPSATAMQTEFASRDALLTHVTEYSLAQGYAVVIHKSNVPRGQLWLRCDLGGAAREVDIADAPPSAATETRKRKRKSSQRQQNCPFRLYGRRLATGAWVLKVQNSLHTHQLASHVQELVTHPKARRLTNAQKRLVLELTDVGIRPAVIVERLKARFPDKPIAVQDIYNARNHIRMERRAGRVPFPEASEGLDDDGAKSDDTRQSHPPSREEALQRMWTAISEIVPRWPDEKQNEFIHNVYSLLEDPQNVEAVARGREERDPNIPALQPTESLSEEPVPTTHASTV